MDRNLDRALSQLVEEIEHIEETRRRFGQVLRTIKQGIDLGRFPALATNVLETQLVTRIEPTDLSGLRIAGIDGGLVKRSFRSIDLLLTRGIAVIFEFGPWEGPRVEFFPGPFPEPQVKPIASSLSGLELDQLASLERTATELRVALAVLEKFDTDLILMDGSLFYHPRDRPSTGSPVFEKFQEVMALYRQLYTGAGKRKTTLVGVVKDSRSTRVVNLLGDILPHLVRSPSVFEMMQGVDYRWLLKISRDCELLDTFLEEGERTFLFSYSSELVQNSNALVDDLSSWASNIWVTYLRTARDDLPIRIEVLVASGNTVQERAERALRAILPLSWSHSEYGVPTPILEADARARISNDETQLIVDRLMALSGLTYASLEKRRSRNPFGG